MRMKAAKTASFDDFTTLIHKLLKAAWGQDWGKFIQAFPNGMDPECVDFPIITYHCKRKVPGQVGKDTKEIKPRFRETIYPTEEGEPDAYNIYGQVFDLHVVFDVWEETNVKADALAEKFENFMMTYMGYMMQQGVQRIVFVEQTDFTEADPVRDSAVVRSFQYLVRIEKVVQVPTSVIKEVIGQVSIMDTEASSSIDETIRFNI